MQLRVSVGFGLVIRALIYKKVPKTVGSFNWDAINTKRHGLERNFRAGFMPRTAYGANKSIIHGFSLVKITG